jgi:hypothetical protein
MPRIKYKEIPMGEKRLVVVKQANAILEEYRAQGFTMTLRQLYYQFVARDLIPNTLRSYKRLGDILNDARLGGMIDWLSLEDMTRSLRSHSSWGEPSDIIQSAASGYARDWWEGQPVQVEVWIEKDALVNVIEGVCSDWQVPYFSCRGYTSQSAMWLAAQRFVRRAQKDQQRTMVVHFGDHDPSGIDMSRDIEDRIRLFMGSAFEEEFEFRRVALNMDQIEEYEPPPNPVKLGDSRSDGYQDRFGQESWELDALEPRVIADLIRSVLLDTVNEETMETIKRDEEVERRQLQLVADKWDAVSDFVEE